MPGEMGSPRRRLLMMTPTMGVMNPKTARRLAEWRCNRLVNRMKQKPATTKP